MYKPILLTICLTILAGCARKQGAALADRTDEFAVREAAFRELLGKQLAASRDVLGKQPADYVYFIAENGSAHDLEECIDLPDEFMSRFADLKLTLKKASTAKYGPKHRVIDPATGKDGVICAARIKRWNGPDACEVSIAWGTAPMQEQGYTLVLKKMQGKWVVLREHSPWVS